MFFLSRSIAVMVFIDGGLCPRSVIYMGGGFVAHFVIPVFRLLILALYAILNLSISFGVSLRPMRRR